MPLTLLPHSFRQCLQASVYIVSSLTVLYHCAWTSYKTKQDTLKSPYKYYMRRQTDTISIHDFISFKATEYKPAHALKKVSHPKNTKPTCPTSSSTHKLLFNISNSNGVLKTELPLSSEAYRCLMAKYRRSTLPLTGRP